MFIRRTTDKSQKVITPKKQVMNTVKDVLSLDGMLVSELITRLQQIVSFDPKAIIDINCGGEDYYSSGSVEITYRRPETDLERRLRLQAKKKERERKKSQKKAEEERERAMYEQLKRKYGT